MHIEETPVSGAHMRALWIVAALACSLAVSSASAASGQSTAFVRTIYLVRHGAYIPDPKADPRLGASLTPLGIAQARLTASRLRMLPIRYSSMVSSPLARAKETAAVLHQTLTEVDPKESASLTECTPPTRNLKINEEMTPEEITRCQAQIEKAFKTYFVPAKGADRYDILVAHGNVIRFLALRALAVDAHAWLGMSIAHASLTVIRIRADGSMSVLSVGDVGHIPPSLRSWGNDNDPQLVLPD